MWFDSPGNTLPEAVRNLARTCHENELRLNATQYGDMVTSSRDEDTEPFVQLSIHLKLGKFPESASYEEITATVLEELERQQELLGNLHSKLTESLTAKEFTKEQLSAAEEARRIYSVSDEIATDLYCLHGDENVTYKYIQYEPSDGEVPTSDAMSQLVIEYTKTDSIDMRREPLEQLRQIHSRMSEHHLQQLKILDGLTMPLSVLPQEDAILQS